MIPTIISAESIYIGGLGLSWKLGHRERIPLETQKILQLSLAQAGIWNIVDSKPWKWISQQSANSILMAST